MNAIDLDDIAHQLKRIADASQMSEAYLGDIYDLLKSRGLDLENLKASVQRGTPAIPPEFTENAPALVAAIKPDKMPAFKRALRNFAASAENFANQLGRRFEAMKRSVPIAAPPSSDVH